MDTGILVKEAVATALDPQGEKLEAKDTAVLTGEGVPYLSISKKSDKTKFSHLEANEFENYTEVSGQDPKGEKLFACAKVTLKMEKTETVEPEVPESPKKPRFLWRRMFLLCHPLVPPKSTGPYWDSFYF